MAVSVLLIVPMTLSDPDTVCCTHCAEPIEKVLHLSNNYGMFTVTHDFAHPSSGQWIGHFPASISNAAATQPDPTDDPGVGRVGPCVKPADDDADDVVTIGATVSCPMTAGGAWSVVYSAPGETRYHRLIGAAFAGKCGIYSIEAVPSNRVSATAGCGTAQTFPAPSTTWTGPTGHAYLSCPDVGVSTLST